MVVAVFVLTLASCVLFTGLGIAALMVATHDRSPRVREMSSVAALCCGAFALGAIQRAGLLADRYGWVDEPTVDVLVHELQLAKAATSVAMAIAATTLGVRVLRGLRSSERLITAFSGHVRRPDPEFRLRLTQREAQVLDLISEGLLSDAQIAERLCISPHTAHSHVRNLMKKAMVSSRRELLWISHEQRDGSPR